MHTPTSNDWIGLRRSLDENGYARIPGLLSPDECREVRALYDEPQRYRTIIQMERYRFGRGEYKYFSYPLPGMVQQLRESLYTPLADLGNEWMMRLSMETRFPSSHAELLVMCRNAAQVRPTPLILRYTTGGFNTLHQDLYGEVFFPFQVVCMLNEPGSDYEGGEFTLVEQIPRAQSKATALTLHQGEGLIFTTNFRPMQGTRGYYRGTVKHGISTVTRGIRQALGIIFHDAP